MSALLYREEHIPHRIPAHFAMFRAGDGVDLQDFVRHGFGANALCARMSFTWLRLGDLRVDRRSAVAM
jgi:hypothetical protein